MMSFSPRNDPGWHNPLLYIPPLAPHVSPSPPQRGYQVPTSWDGVSPLCIFDHCFLQHHRLDVSRQTQSNSWNGHTELYPLMSVNCTNVLHMVLLTIYGLTFHLHVINSKSTGPAFPMLPPSAYHNLVHNSHTHNPHLFLPSSPTIWVLLCPPYTPQCTLSRVVGANWTQLHTLSEATYGVLWRLWWLCSYFCR
jgi:hypothetical protein